MWLGERITERGIGNGISIIIFAGIVAGLLPSGKTLLDMISQEIISVAAVGALLAFMVLVVGVVCYVERGMRRIPVQYAKRMAGRRMFAGQATYFPMKVNTAGVIPPIFAGALLSRPPWAPGSRRCRPCSAASRAAPGCTTASSCCSSSSSRSSTRR
jgi:preprotein translocase subunit SecY